MRIAILDDYQDVARAMADWSRLSADAELRVFTDHEADPDRLAARLAPFEVLCVMRERTPLPAALIERLPNLQLIVTTGPHNASIDLSAAAGRGITVCGTRGLGYPTAELAWALILALVLGLPEQTASMRAGGWQAGLGARLRGRTLGIVGLGRLGAMVAGYAAAFGMTRLAWSPDLTDERAARHGAERVEFDGLLARSDAVTIHARLNAGSRGLFGAAALGRMKPGAYLVNTSRGPIVDTGALVAAVRSGHLAGAALDVFDAEPLPADDPLRAEARILLTPHIGYASREAFEIMYRDALDAILAWRAGAPVRVIEP